MARMLSQLPLPLLPPGAAEIAPGVGLLAGEDGGLVAVHGLATFAWDAGDEAGRRLAAVQLVRLRAASQGQVAEAFGVDPATIWRWDQAAAAGGVAGLVPARRGPEGRVEADARAGGPDRRAGRRAGRRCGRSRRRPGSRRSPSAPRWAGSGRAARAAPGPVTPVRTARLISGDGEDGRGASRCRCCRIRCPGTGSGRWPGGGCSARAPSRSSPPVPGTRWPGCCWPCPPLEGTGLLEAARQVYGRLQQRLLRAGCHAADLGVPGPGRRAPGRGRHPGPARGAGPGARPGPGAGSQDDPPQARRARRGRQGSGPDHGAGPPARRRPARGAGVPATPTGTPASTTAPGPCRRRTSRG